MAKATTDVPKQNLYRTIHNLKEKSFLILLFFSKTLLKKGFRSLYNLCLRLLSFTKCVLFVFIRSNIKSALENMKTARISDEQNFGLIETRNIQYLRTCNIFCNSYCIEGIKANSKEVIISQCFCV